MKKLYTFLSCILVSCFAAIYANAQCTPPTVQATAFTASQIKAYSMTIGWTRGNGNRVLVLARAGSNVNANPTSGTVYTANSVFGSGQEVGTGNFVVYRGAGTSVTVTGLSLSTTYYFKVYELLDADVCYKTPPLFGNATTLSTCSPSTQASDFSIPVRGDYAMGIEWIRGDGDGVLVVARADGEVNADPVNGVNYSANPTFGSGTPIGTGNYVVYKGTGTYAPVTSLAYNKTYYYKIYEYNNDGLCYLTPGLAGNAITGVTIQASSFTYSQLSQNSLKLSWTRGNGNRVLVVGRAGSAVNAEPVNGTNYFDYPSYGFGAGTQIGTSNYVVYNGDLNYCTITGLTSGTTYYFKIYEYFSGSGLNYKTPGLEGNAATPVCNVPSAQATSFIASNIGQTTMRISCTAGNGDCRIFVIKEGSPVDADPLSGKTYSYHSQFGLGEEIGTGNYVLTRGYVTSVDVTGLKPNTTYYYSIYEYNSTGQCYKLQGLKGSATTLSCTAPTTQASSFNTSQIKSYSMNLNWTRGNGNYILVVGREGAPVDVDPTSGVSYSASPCFFGGGSKIGANNYVLYSGPASTVSISCLKSSTTYYFKLYEYNSAFNCYLTPGIEGSATTASCVPSTQASAFTSSSITKNSMTLGWTQGSGGSVLIVARAGSPVNADPVSGVTYSYSQTFGNGQEIGTGNFVVSKSSGMSSANVNGLLPNTTYYFKLYEFDYRENCYKTPGLEGYATTLPCYPTVQATAFTSSQVGASSMNIGWTRGNGYKVLVVARANWATGAEPVNGINYTANSSLGLGSEIGSNNYVVYNGTGNSFTIDGLMSNSTYVYKIYEYSSDYCYAPSPLAGSVSTNSFVQASSFTSSNVAGNTMTISWTRGNGSEVIVIAREGGAVNSDPTNGGSYVASSTFGSGSQIGTGNYVVYKGTGNSVYISGLKSSTGYYFKVYECGRYEYATPGLTGNATTASCTPTTQATSFSASNIGDNSMTIGWVRGNGSNVLVVARAGVAVDADPVNGTTYNGSQYFGNGSQLGGGNYVVYSGTGNNCSVVSLTLGITYYYKIYEYNSTEKCYKTPGLECSATTSVCYPSLQASLFASSNVKSNTMSISWTRGNGNGVLVLAKAGAPVDAAPVSGTAYIGSTLFGGANQIGNGNYVVYVGEATSANLSALSSSTTYHFAIFEKSASNCYKTPGLTGSVTTAQCTPTIQTSSFNASNITSNSMIIGWTRGSGNNVLVVARKGSAVNADPTNGLGYTGNATFGSGSQIGTGNYVVYMGSGSSVSVSGLEANTTYHYRIYDFNSLENCYKIPGLTGSASTLTTSIEAIGDDKGVVFPNPFSNELTIRWKGNTKTINYEIVNSFGIIVTKGIMKDEVIIPTNKFSSGVYIIRLSNGSRFEFFKVVKQ